MGPLCRMPPRSSVPWSPRGPASWCPSLSPPRSALTSPRRSAPGPGPTPGLSRSLLSRSGAMSQLRSPASLKKVQISPESFKIKKAEVISDLSFVGKQDMRCQVDKIGLDGCVVKHEFGDNSQKIQVQL